MIEFRQQDAQSFLADLPDKSVDLVVFSPPYALKTGRYRDMPANHYTPETARGWIDWMAVILYDCCRVSRGMVFCVVDSPRDKKTGRYIPVVEGLQWKLHDDDLHLAIRTPHVWHKNGPPGGPHYPGHDYEIVVSCHHPDIEPFYDPSAIGHSAKYDSGPGRQRKSDGSRSLAKQGCKKGTLSRPRDVVRVTVGGGHMGRKGANGKEVRADGKLATAGEAPYPVALPHYFIRGWSRPGDTVCDPFGGTGTTAVAAKQLGRNFIGSEIRQSQILIAGQRIMLMDSENDA